MEEVRVIVYGDSLILAGVQAVLRAHPGIEVITFTTSDKGLTEELRAVQPVVVVFDLGGIHPLVPPLYLLSDLVLIGIDPERSQALVWSGRREATVATDGLVNLIYTLGGDAQSRPSRPHCID